MGTEATAVAAPAPAAAPAVPAPAAPAAAAAPAPAAAAPAAPAPAAAAPAPAANDAAAITAAETALATATAAAQGKPADSPEAKAVATAKTALDALKPAPAAAAPAKVVPDAYADFKTPDGVVIDKTVAAEVKAVAKELKLTQDEAQKLIDKVGPVLAKSDGTRLTAIVEKHKTEWAEQSRTDPEIGGDKLDENLALAKKTFDAFGTPALKETLQKTGLESHPELLRWAMRIGKAIGPDNKFVAGTTLNRPGIAPEDKLWPNK